MRQYAPTQPLLGWVARLPLPLFVLSASCLCVHRAAPFYVLLERRHPRQQHRAQSCASWYQRPLRIVSMHETRPRPRPAAGCLAVRFCGRACQRLAWQMGHRRECTSMAAATRSASAAAQATASDRQRTNEPPDTGVCGQAVGGSGPESTGRAGKPGRSEGDATAGMPGGKENVGPMRAAVRCVSSKGASRHGESPQRAELMQLPESRLT